MQVCTSTGLPRGDVRNNLVSCRHQADQVLLGRAFPAPDTGADRRSACGVQLTGPWPERYLALHLARNPDLAQQLRPLTL